MRAEKQFVIEELKAAIESASAVIFTGYTGTSAEKMGALRRALDEQHGRYMVVKNRLFARAAKTAGLEGELPGFAGQVGVAFSDEEASMPVLKALVGFHKENERFDVLGGFLNRQPCTGAELRELSKLPPKPVMQAWVLGALQAVPRGFVCVLAGRLRSLLYVINARIDAEGGVPADPDAPSGDEAAPEPEAHGDASAEAAESG